MSKILAPKHLKLNLLNSDLCVEHIVLDTKGHVMFVDFAKARSLDPELVCSEAIAQRKMLDFWQLGCLVYELLTGEKLVGFEQDEENILNENILEVIITFLKEKYLIFNLRVR